MFTARYLSGIHRVFITFAGLIFKDLFRQYILLFFSIVILASCSEYNKILKSNDAELKYTEAKKLYEKEQYIKAAPLFDDLLVRFKGDKRFEEVYYLFARCKFEMREIPLASYHFKNFYESFPLSTRAEEALYMHVYCSYLESYPYYLDPETTRQAMDNFQLFINVYPQSPKVEECNKYMDELRGRLRKKAVMSARLYLKMEDYRAAIIAFKNAIKDFPEIENRDELQFLIVKSSFLLAQNSIESKKIERFEDVLKAFTDFAEDAAPESPYYKDANQYNEKAKQQLNQLKSNTKQ